MMSGLTLFERGLVAHLVADWLLQNEWMARNKGNLSHPAGWVHALIHVLLLGLALGWLGGLVLGVLHLLTDSGRVIEWWAKHVKKCDASPNIMLVKIGTDQALHIALIAGWVMLKSAFPSL